MNAVPGSKSSPSRWQHIWRTVAITANALLALLTLASAYGGVISPTITAIGAILAMLFPAFIVLTATVTVINALFYRRMVLINAASLILCAGPIWNICPLNLLRPAADSPVLTEPDVVKVMTFNVLDFEDFTRRDTASAVATSRPGVNPTVDFILNSAPDILICQEATDLYNQAPGYLRHHDIDSLYNYYPYRYTSRRGMALLSRFPFRRVEVNIGDENVFDVCRYDVSVHGQLIHIFNVHLQSIGLTDNDKAMYRSITSGDTPGGGISEIRHSLIHKLAEAYRIRAVQARDIREVLDTLPGNIILAGDFNDIPGSYAARTIAGAGLTDAYSHAGLGPAITYHADRFYFRIDHIFYRGDINALRVEAIRCPSSDHYPLEAYFSIPHPK